MSDRFAPFRRKFPHYGVMFVLRTFPRRHQRTIQARQPRPDIQGSLSAWINSGDAVNDASDLPLNNTDLERARVLYMVLDSIDVGFFTLDREWRFTYINRFMQRYGGAPVETLIGRNLWEVSPELIGTETEANYRRAMNEGIRVDFEAAGAPTATSPSEIFDTHIFPTAEGLSIFLLDFSKRREAETALRRSEAFRAGILDAALDAIIMVDANSTVVEWNPSAERIFGYRRDEAMGREMSELIIPPEFRDAHQQGMKRYLATGEGPVLGSRLQLPAMRKDGSSFPAELTITSIVAGDEMQFAGFLRDITDRKRSEQMLRHSESQANFLVALNDQTRRFGDPDQIIAASARLLGEYLGVDRCAYAEVEPDENHFYLTGDYNAPGVQSIVGYYAMSDFGARVLQLMREGLPYVVEDVDEELPEEDDLSAYRLTDIRAVICMPLHKDGKFTACMAVHMRTPRRWTESEVEMVRLVTERCWESIERARAIRNLRESERQFRTLADSIPQMAWMAQPDGHIFWYNRRWYDYMGTSEEENPEGNWESAYDPEVMPEVIRQWNISIATGELFDMVVPLRGADGEFRQFLTRMIPVRDDRGDVVRWFGTNTDITEAQKLQQEREHILASERAARTEAERLNRMKDEFLSTVSHELRTPLNAMFGWSELMRMGGLSDDDMQTGMEVIHRNVRIQTQIVEDLLDMSRIISGKLRLDVQRVNLPEIINASLESVRPAAEAKDIRLQKIVDPLAGPIAGDPSRLQQIIWNLLSNAVKFTPKGGRVQILLERVNSHIEMSVADTGEGIAPEHLPHIFERFHQADSSTTRRHGGLGLGLAISKSLVEMHGGSIRAKSPGVGAGTTFIIALPVVPLSSERGDAERTHPRTHRGAEADYAPISLAGILVLVVDDDMDGREIVRRVLHESEATVMIASSALEALQMISETRPDVIVSDIGMPGMDGYQFIRTLRSRPVDQGGSIPAIALTAFARSEDRSRAIRAGYQIHLSKPAEPSELVTVVASLAGRL